MWLVITSICTWFINMYGGNNAFVFGKNYLVKWLQVKVTMKFCSDSAHITIHCTRFMLVSELHCKQLGAISSQTFHFPLQLQGWYWYRASRTNPELKLVHLQSWLWVQPTAPEIPPALLHCGPSYPQWGRAIVPCREVVLFSDVFFKLLESS